MPTLPGFPCLAATEPEFRRGILKVAADLDMSPDWLAGVMFFESQYDPAVANAKGSGATGLIQWISDSAKRLGTTTCALRNMTRMEQLPYVYRFLQWTKGKLKRPEDIYLAIFYPCAIGKPENWVVALRNPDPTKKYCGQSADLIARTYEQNAGAFDKANRGYYTKSDITSAFLKVYHDGLSRPRIDVDAPAVANVQCFEASAKLAKVKAGPPSKQKAAMTCKSEDEFERESESTGYTPSMTVKVAVLVSSVALGFVATKVVQRAVQQKKA